MSEAAHDTHISVRYSETDQMGVVYHAHYLVWCDAARTNLLKQRGANYRDLENGGLRLAVTEASLKYRQAARYDDQVRVRCWVRDLTSRSVEFGYLIERPADGARLATARTKLMALDQHNRLSTLPDEVRKKLVITEDPVRL